MVRPKDVTTFEHLMRFYYGIRCLLLSNFDKVTSKGGVLFNKPKSLNLLAMKELTRDDYEGAENIKYPYRLLRGEEEREVSGMCERHILGLWDDFTHRDKWNKVKIDYCLYLSTKYFY